MPDPSADVTVFARDILRAPLWAHQEEAARSEAFITAVAAARRTGKTRLAQTLAAWTAFKERDCRVVILSAGQDAARLVVEELGAILASSPLTRGAVVDDYATKITLTNGSTIVSLPASQRQVRGHGRRVKLLVIDEAGFVPEELWRAARYIALDERGNGSRNPPDRHAWGTGEMFFRRAYDLGRDGDPEHSAHHWTYRANPDLDHLYLERERGRTAPAEYAAEVLGEWSDAVGALFPAALLDRQTADLDLPTFADLRGPARLIVAADWGVSFDRSALVVVARLPVAALNPERELRPTFTLLPTVFAAGRPLGEVVDTMVDSPAPWAFISSEVNGVGAMPSQEVQRRIRGRAGPSRTWYATNTTSRLKTAGYGCLLALLERGQLVLPRDPDLLRQLAGLRFEQGERGFTRIAAEDPAQHDDVADAAYLATPCPTCPGAPTASTATSPPWPRPSAPTPTPRYPRTSRRWRRAAACACPGARRCKASAAPSSPGSPAPNPYP